MKISRRGQSTGRTPKGPPNKQLRRALWLDLGRPKKSRVLMPPSARTTSPARRRTTSPRSGPSSASLPSLGARESVAVGMISRQSGSNGSLSAAVGSKLCRRTRVGGRVPPLQDGCAQGGEARLRRSVQNALAVSYRDVWCQLRAAHELPRQLCLSVNLIQIADYENQDAGSIPAASTEISTCKTMQVAIFIGFVEYFVP